MCYNPLPPPRPPPNTPTTQPMRTLTLIPLPCRRLYLRATAPLSPLSFHPRGRGERRHPLPTALASILATRRPPPSDAGAESGGASS
jgi:hypothetical protein